MFVLLAPVFLLLDNTLHAADKSPLPPREKVRCTRSGRYCAVANAMREKTMVYQARDGKPEKPLWSILGWHPLALPPDDGHGLVVGYPIHLTFFGGRI